MKDKILDQIFKFGRNQKEVLYDNFDEICKIIGIKTAQTSEDTGVMETPDSSVPEEFEAVPALNFAQKADEAAAKLINDKNFSKILSKINSTRTKLPELANDADAYKKQEESLALLYEKSYDYVKNFIEENDYDFFLEIEDNYGEEDTESFKGYLYEIINVSINKAFGALQQPSKAPQIPYSDYLSILAYELDKNLLIEFKNKKREKDQNPKGYLTAFYSLLNNLKLVNDSLGINIKYQDSHSQVKQIIDSQNIDKADELFEQLILILGDDIPVDSEEKQQPDQYVQERMEEMAFAPTGEPFEKNGKWFQVYGHIWTVPIKTKRDENGNIVADIEVDSETGENIVTPTIDTDVLQALHNNFISNTEVGLKDTEEDLVSSVKDIFLRSESFSQSRFDDMQKQLLSKVWALYRERNPDNSFFQKDFFTIDKSSDEYKNFTLMIREEDINDIIKRDFNEETGEFGPLGRFFENLKYAKTIIRDISGYAARATIASSTIISPESYNYIISFCENYYGKDLEFLESDNYKSLGNLIKSWNNGESLGELDSQAKYIYENIIPEIIESTESKSEEEAFKVLDRLFDPEKIRYFKNVKDRAVDFAEQQELSHTTTYSYHGNSNFCKHCGRFRGRKFEAEKYGGATGVNKIKGRYYYTHPERDKNIVLSPADAEHMDPNTIEKYFQTDAEGNYIQKRCDFQRNNDGSVFGSCDIVDNILFEGYSTAPSINETFRREVPVVMDGEQLKMETGRKTETGEPEILPIQLNEQENELVQTFTSILLDDYLEQIQNYFIENGMTNQYGLPVVKALKPQEEQSDISDVSEVSKGEMEDVVIDRKTLREALKEYLECTTSRISDSVLGLDVRMHPTGPKAIEYAIKAQRSSRILFHALQAYNYTRHIEENEEELDEAGLERARERAQFLAGSDLLQLFGCGAYWTNKTMMKSVGLTKGPMPNIPLSNKELDVPMTDASGKPITGEDGETQLTIREFLQGIKEIPFLNADLPSEDSVSMGFIYSGEGTGSGYDSRMRGVTSFADEALKKAHAIEIYRKIKNIIANPNLTIEQREDAISSAWNEIRFGYIVDENGEKIPTSDPAIYKKVKIPSYTTKPDPYRIDQNGIMVPNERYAQQLSNWVRQHFVEGHVKLSEQEMAFYAIDPSKAAETFITMMDDMFSTFDFDMPYKGVDETTDTDIEVFVQEGRNFPKIFFGFTDEEYDEATSDERKDSYIQYTRQNPDWMPMPQKGDAVRVKNSENDSFEFYAILDLVNYDQNSGQAEYLVLPARAYRGSELEGEKINDYEIEEAYDYDAYFESIEKPYKFIMEVQNGAVDRSKYHVIAGEGANILNNPVSILGGRFKDKYYYMGSDQDRAKFVEAAIARWFDRTPVVSGDSKENKKKRDYRKTLLSDPYYKDIYDRREELDTFARYYAFSKFKDALDRVRGSGIPEDAIAGSALQELHMELKSSYASQKRDQFSRSDEENMLLLKHRIFKDIIQMSIIDKKSFKEISEDLGINIDQFFGGIEEHKLVDDTIQGIRAEYLPSFFPNLSSGQEDLRHFSKSGVAAIVCDTGAGDQIGREMLLGHMTGFTSEGERVSPQERTVLTQKAFTTLTEKMMKLSFLNKEVASRIFDYINDLSQSGAYVVSFTPKINQLFGILGLNMAQASNFEGAERPATITRAMSLYANAQRGAVPNRVAGFPLGVASFAYRSESDLGSANEFKWNMSPIHMMLQAIPEWGMGGVSFVEGLNTVIQGGRPETFGEEATLEEIRRKYKNKKKADKETWYKFAQNKDISYNGEFTHVVITSSGDLANCVKNSQLRSRNKARTLPYIKVVPYQNFGSIKRVLDFKKRTGYNAIILTDAEYGFLSQVGLIPNA